MGSHDKIGPPTSAARNNRATRRRSLGVVGSVIGVIAFVAMSGSPARAATAPTLGTAASFAVLAASEVTNTGPSVISGDVGVSPSVAVTGFPPGIVVDGTIYRGGEVAANAQADARTAYNSLAGQPCPPENDLTGKDLGGMTLTPGIYCSSSSAQLTGPLTLDAGSPDAVFIFQIGSTLTIASASSVVFSGEANPCNVFWQVGSSATLGTTTNFKGTVIADTSITATTGADVEGRLLALTGAVTLDTNDITRPVCATGDTSTTTVPETTTTVPETTTTTTVPETTTTTVPETTTTTVPETTTTTTVPETTIPVPETTTTVPETTPTGPVQTTSTTLVAAGKGSGPDVVTAALRTGEDGTLPRTGSAGAAMTATGLLAIVAGNLLLEARRRRPVAIGSSSPRRR